MLLNPYLYKENDNKLISDQSLKEAGIIYHKRKIYILKKYTEKCFGENSIFNSYMMNNVILVNISRSKLDNGLYRTIKSVYSFSYTGMNEDIISEFKNSRLKLNYCITSGYDSNKTFKEGIFENSDFYNDLGFTFGYDENDMAIEVNLNDMYSDCNINIPSYDESEEESYAPGKISIKIPDPRYYTVEQYEKDKHEEYTSIMQKDRYFDAISLIDDVSDIYLVNENEQERMNKSECSNALGDLVPINSGDSLYEMWEKMKDAQELPFDMFLLNSQACFTSYKFIYDSKDGFNIKDINTDKNIIKSRNSDYIEMIAIRMKEYCDKLTKIYGNLRIYYYSSDISESIEIIFEDKTYHKITSTFDKTKMFERLMVFITDKYEPYINQQNEVNYDNYNDYFALT